MPRKQIFLLDLPNELLYLIVRYATNPKDLLMTCHRFYSIVYPSFPELVSASSRYPTIMLHWAITTRNETLFRRLFTHVPCRITFYDPPDHPDKIIPTIDDINEITARVVARPTTIRLEEHCCSWTYKGGHKNSALMHAILTRNVKMVKHFTKTLSPATMFRSQYLDLPFDTAMSNFGADKTDTNYITILKILFKTVHKKHYSLCCGHFCAPLSCAVLHNFEDEVRDLALRGASFDDKDTAGHTPLTLAILVNDDQMAKLLIELNPKSFLKQTGRAVAVAREKGNGSMARYMMVESLRLAGVDRVYGWSALHMAVVDKDERLVEELLATDIYVDHRDNSGRTPLHLAVNNEDVSTAILMLLIKNGAKVSEKDYRGKTPLHLATRQRSLLAVRILLHAGADVNAEDIHGDRPLEIAHKLAYTERYRDISSALVYIYGGAIPK